MSVRIYQLSKELELTNKELLEILQGRGFDVKSASSTIPNIYADALVDELGKKAKGNSQKSPLVPKDEKKPTEKTEETPAPTTQMVEAPEIISKKPASHPHTPLPPKAVVKTATQVAEEKKLTATQSEPNITSTLTEQDSSTHLPKIPVPKAPAAPPLPSLKKPSHSVVIHDTARPARPPSFRPTRPQEAQTVNLGTSTTPQAQTAQLKILQCKPPIVLRDFATMLGVKPFKLISELMEMGHFASMNQSITEEIAIEVALKYGFSLQVQHRNTQSQLIQQEEQKKVEPKASIAELEPRPPIVCVLGHVDHGKTTLLDVIRKTNVVAGEAGGITQHIGAYQVEHNKHLITFIDTPGHAAFSKMRERGANITDIAILVVAADDGFMPQTKEALQFAQKANVPIIVAINKMDAKGANIDRAKQQMQEHGITSEDWGGEVLTTPVSALKGENIDELLDLVLLQTEMLELKAPVKCSASGIVLEAQIEVGRGPTATLIIEEGTLNIGDAIVCGTEYCKVRALIDDKGKQLKSAGPATPVLVLGFSGSPASGTTFEVVKNEREAKRIAEDRIHHNKHKKAQSGTDQKPMDLDSLFAAIANTQENTLRIVLKGDVKGTVEALKGCLENIKSEKIKLEIIGSDVGAINKNDINVAHAGNAIIVAFNTKLEPGAQSAAKHNNVTIIQHNIIYELIDRVKEIMLERLDSTWEEKVLGRAEVRQIFTLSKKIIAGSMVSEGVIKRDARARVLRGKKKEVVFDGTVQSLRRQKEDSQEVRSGYECGIGISNFANFEVGDLIECYELVEVPPTL